MMTGYDRIPSALARRAAAASALLAPCDRTVQRLLTATHQYLGYKITDKDVNLIQIAHAETLSSRPGELLFRKGIPALRGLP